MERDALEYLSREELLALPVHQAEMVGQQEEVAAREAAIERRDGQSRALEEELFAL